MGKDLPRLRRSPDCRSSVEEGVLGPDSEYAVAEASTCYESIGDRIAGEDVQRKGTYLKTTCRDSKSMHRAVPPRQRKIRSDT